MRATLLAGSHKGPHNQWWVGHKVKDSTQQHVHHSQGFGKASNHRVAQWVGKARVAQHMHHHKWMCRVRAMAKQQHHSKCLHRDSILMVAE